MRVRGHEQVSGFFLPPKLLPAAVVKDDDSAWSPRSNTASSAPNIPLAMWTKYQRALLGRSIIFIVM
jgi:hypothetical protein